MEAIDEDDDEDRRSDANSLVEKREPRRSMLRVGSRKAVGSCRALETAAPPTESTVHAAVDPLKPLDRIVEDNRHALGVQTIRNVSSRPVTTYDASARRKSGRAVTPVTRPATPHYVDSQIDALMRQLRSQRSRVFDTQLPFSWYRWLVGIVAYLLLFSDIPRSGLGVRSLRDRYDMIEPDVFQFFGPWSYSISKLYRNATLNNATTKIWDYKFETTSISWRAFARWFELDTFPKCVLYEEACNGTTMKSSTAFNMIDSMSSALETRAMKQHTHAVTLRSTSNYWDRVHHYLIPQMFVHRVWRTNRALFYDAAITRRSDFELCARKTPGTRPLACNELWTNFRRSCAKTNLECQDTGVVWDHIVSRVRTAQHQFPGLEVDLTILESAEDAQVCAGGLSTLARRLVDISTIIRARNCSLHHDNRCTTEFLEDYRYQSAFYLSDVLQWYRVVIILRGFAQTYFGVRVIMLFASCAATRAAEERYQHASRTDIWKAAYRVFARLPTHAVIYGSPVPVLCYAFAHLIDSPFTYEMVAAHFFQPVGRLNIGVMEFVVIASTQMRNVWFLATCIHVVVVSTTWHSWSPVNGIIGVPPLTMSVISMTSILLQLRSPALRNTRVIDISEVPTTGTAPLLLKRFTTFTHRGNGNTLLEGAVIDIKLFVCLTITVLVIVLTHRACRRIWDSIRPNPILALRNSKPHFLAMARTPVPYSAGVIWPTVVMCVQWRGTLFHKHTRPSKLTNLRMFQKLTPGKISKIFATAQATPEPTGPTIHMMKFGPSRDLMLTLPGALSGPATRRTTRSAQSSRGSVLGSVVGPISSGRRLSMALFSWFAEWPAQGTGFDTLDFLQFHMEHVHSRRGEVDAIVALINLVAMSDPFVWLRLKLAAGIPLGYYESRRSNFKIILLPVAVVGDQFHSKELCLLRHVSSADLKWSNLIHCG
ncbi:TPA: hypothetical protein N0F65_011839 [Lagenidium giganteum]|uniref:Uncharacterized protein n=1 Tax=Lagenidium giganteum TaxID=4803 RepID=A0AAV2YZT2_9STRA|nr:TPA: hypothetical protein N0F65_011839 [Lagenidium giganteum]